MSASILFRNCSLRSLAWLRYSPIFTDMTDSRFEHLTDVVDFYSWKQFDEKERFSLSEDQRRQLTEVRDELSEYSKAGDAVASLWLECANELLN